MTLFVDSSELFNEQCCTSSSSSDFTCEDLAKCPKIIEIEALLPTEDQKDAMDNANHPDGTNPFATMADIGGGGTLNLQQVTDNGNTTDNDIQFDAGVGVLLDNGSRLREGTIDAGFGGTKGIAQICAVGYELKWEAGRLYVMDGNGLLIRHSLYNFTTLPSATDDSTKGYYVGSLWTLDNGVSYICTDSTSGAATWNIYQDLSGLAPLASPTFTGTVVLPSTTSIGTVSDTEIGYLDGVTQSIQPALTDTRIRKVSDQSNTDASTSATAVETVLKTLLVPTLGADTTLKIMSEIGKVGTAVNAVFKMYYNTTPDLSGSPVQIALLNFTATQVFSPFNRDITNKNSVTANSIFPATATSANAIISTFPRTDLNVDLSGKYIVITGKAGSVADSVRVDNARLLIEE